MTAESLGAAVSYRLRTDFIQSEVAINAVTPMNGPPGTLVTIDGSGFSARLADNQVFFASIAGEVVTATPTRLQVRVPANAVNGDVEVISFDRQRSVPGFVTGDGEFPA